MNATVAVFGTLRFPPERMSEIRPHIKALVDATREFDGCIAYDISEDLFDAGLVRFSELWPDHDALARHFVAPHIAAWKEASRKCAVSGRKFTAYDLAGAKEL